MKEAGEAQNETMPPLGKPLAVEDMPPLEDGLELVDVEDEDAHHHLKNRARG